jgi:hypothetical protein
VGALPHLLVFLSSVSRLILEEKIRISRACGSHRRRHRSEVRGPRRRPAQPIDVRAAAYFGLLPASLLLCVLSTECISDSRFFGGLESARLPLTVVVYVVICGSTISAAFSMPLLRLTSCALEACLPVVSRTHSDWAPFAPRYHSASCHPGAERECRLTSLSCSPLAFPNLFCFLAPMTSFPFVWMLHTAGSHPPAHLSTSDPRLSFRFGQAAGSCRDRWVRAGVRC